MATRGSPKAAAAPVARTTAPADRRVTKSASPLEDSLVMACFDRAADYVGPKYGTYITMVKPAVLKTMEIIDVSWPFFVQAWKFLEDLWIKLQPYDPKQFAPLIFGLVLCFFGGSYVTLIAAVEAVRLTVWDSLKKSTLVLYDNYCKARDASAKDDEVDADGNGIADVKEISKNALLTRKVRLILKTVNPEEASDALLLVWSAILAVVATLRVKFAQSVTLGCSLGAMLHKHLDPTLQPAFREVLPPELKKWAAVCSRYACKIVGITLAWFLQRMISGFHSAIRGGHLFVTNLIILAKKHGYVTDLDENGPKASIIATLVALVGFYWQLSNGFALPFPLNILLLPISFVEWLIEFCVGI